MSAKAGKKLNKTEMLDLLDKLFGCSQPQAAPNGKPTMLTFTLDELNHKFKA